MFEATADKNSDLFLLLTQTHFWQISPMVDRCQGYFPLRAMWKFGITSGHRFRSK